MGVVAGRHPILEAGSCSEKLRDRQWERKFGRGKEGKIEKQEMGPRDECSQRKTRSREQGLVDLNTERGRGKGRRGETELAGMAGNTGGREQRPLSLR